MKDPRASFEEKGGELLPEVVDPDYLAWLEEITSYPRRCGYYLIRRVDIRSWRKLELPEEELLNRLFESFDDKAWPSRDQWPGDQTWQDYQLHATAAQELAVEALAGGNSIGHTGYTIPPERALELWRRFEAFFPPPRSYYQQLGLGDRAYVFLHGVAVVSQEQAGVLWVVESD